MFSYTGISNANIITNADIFGYNPNQNNKDGYSRNTHKYTEELINILDWDNQYKSQESKNGLLDPSFIDELPIEHKFTGVFSQDDTFKKFSDISFGNNNLISENSTNSM